MTQPTSQTNVWLAALWRGGAWGALWRKGDKRTHWTPALNPDARALGSRDVYVSVHPLRERRGERARGRIADVAAINCLFAEFDAKDFGDLAAIRRHITGLAVQPQVIVASGGGYHAYWFFREPVPVTEGGREYLAGVQRAWVRWAGGDPGARDLARVLRLPGTLNCKYDPPRRVQFARFALTPEGRELYDPADLCALAEAHWEDAPGAVDAEPHDAGAPQAQPPARRERAGQSVIEAYNATTDIRALLAHYGYTVGGDRFTRPDKDMRQGISGTIRGNTAYTFSSNDPAFDSNNTSPSGAGCTLRPFDLLCRISFGGNVRAAVKYLHEVTR